MALPSFDETGIIYSATKAIVARIGKPQLQPELASGMSITPLADIMLSQQPGRMAPKRLMPLSLARSYIAAQYER